MSRTPELDIEIDRYVLGVATSEDLVRAADLTTNRGVITPSLAELSVPKDSTRPQLGAIFEEAIRELQRPLPTRSEAFRRVIAYHLRRITTTEISPRQGLAALMRDIYWPNDTLLRSDRYVGDSHGLQHLIGAYWAYDDLEGRPTEVSLNGKFGAEALVENDREVRQLAAEWLEQHAA